MKSIGDLILWAFGGIGVSLITLFFSGLYKLIAQSFFPYSKHLKRYKGNYESYHMATNGSKTIIKSAIKIYPDMLGRMKVRLSSYCYNYYGTIKLKDSNIYLYLKGDGHEEYMLWILSEPLTPVFEIMVGVLSAVTENRMPVGGKVVIVKINREPEFIRLSQNEVREEILSFLNVKGNPIKVSHPDLSRIEDLSKEKEKNIDNKKMEEDIPLC